MNNSIKTPLRAIMSAVSKNLKIGFVLDGGLEKPDGVQQYILALGAYFKSRGHSIKYIVAGDIPSNIEDAVSLSRNIKVNSNGNVLKIPLIGNYRKINNYIKSEKFDVLHIQVPYSPAMGEMVIYSAPKSTAIVGTFHIVPYNQLLAFGDWLLGKWSFLSLRRFDAMFSVSKAAQAVAKRDFNINSVVLPNVLDYKRFKTAKPFKASKQINILFLGRLVERKGCLLLLEAINQIKNDIKLPKFKVTVCGNGPLRSNLEQYVYANELEKLVEFKGFVSETDKPRYYASADISVFPSLGGESFGIVLLEAMSSGRAAVLAGDNDGYRSVMEPYNPASLFDPNDPSELANKLRQLLSSKTKRIQQAKAGSQYAKSFDTAIIGQRLEKIYRQILLKKPSS